MMVEIGIPGFIMIYNLSCYTVYKLLHQKVIWSVLIIPLNWFEVCCKAPKIVKNPCNHSNCLFEIESWKVFINEKGTNNDFVGLFIGFTENSRGARYRGGIWFYKKQLSWSRARNESQKYVISLDIFADI